MAFLGFGKRVKNQRFEYVPRYYDASKEALHNRIKMNNPDASAAKDNAELSKLRIQDGLRRKARGNKELEKKTKRESSIRLLVILIVLIVMAWMFLNSNALTSLFKWLDSTNNIAQ